MNDLTLFTHRSMKLRLRLSLELLIMETLSVSFGSLTFSASLCAPPSDVSSRCSQTSSLSISSQLRDALDGIRSMEVALLAAAAGSESSRPSRLRDRFGAGGVWWDASGEMGVFEPLRTGYRGGRPRGYLLDPMIQVREGLDDL